MPMKVLFCGSRDWVDVDIIRSAVMALPGDCLVIHGDARGADSIADQCARDRGLHVVRVPALWDSYGNRAGERDETRRRH